MTSVNTLVCQEPRRLYWEKRQIPIPDDGEVLIEIKAVGACGINIHAWGDNQSFFNYPHVFRYEICGEIIGLGKSIPNLKSGQRVAMIPYATCRQCSACLKGRTSCCEKVSVIGMHRDGGSSEYLCVPVNDLLVVDDVDPEAVTLIELFAISAHAARRTATQAKEQVLMVGAGPIGLETAAIAKADGAQIVMTDTSPARRDHVAQHPGLITLDPSNPLFTEQLSATLGDSLAQKVIDATGDQQAMDNTVNLIRHSGSIIFVGLFRGELQLSDPEFREKETTMTGSHNATGEDFARIGRLMAEGRITARMVLTHRYDFRSLADIYENDVINNRQLIKGVIHFQQVNL